MGVGKYETESKLIMSQADRQIAGAKRDRPRLKDGGKTRHVWARPTKKERAEHREAKLRDRRYNRRQVNAEVRSALRKERNHASSRP